MIFRDRPLLWLIVISLVLTIAKPLAYCAGDRWLKTYPYRTEVGFETFIGAGLLVLIIAFLTTSYHSIKTALTNPVNTLKQE